MPALAATNQRSLEARIPMVMDQDKVDVNDRPLRILMISRPFFPMVGGLETVAAILAHELALLGQHVTVVTWAGSTQDDSFPYKVVRKPSPWALLKLVVNADRLLIHGVTLSMGWPAFFRPSITAVIHHGFLNSAQRFSWLRKIFLKGVSNVAISQAVAAGLPGQVTCISNPYDAATFRLWPVERRPDSLIFVGRLVPEKGLHVLVKALALLKRDGFCYPLTVLGDGPYRNEIQSLIEANGLGDQINMMGVVVGKPLAELMNAHQLAVIPSVWSEPFGLVALEAIACGCEVIGTDQGGLPEAIGPCGTVVPNGDTEALASAIRCTLTKPSPTSDKGTRKLEHLQRFQPSQVAQTYLQLIR